MILCDVSGCGMSATLLAYAAYDVASADVQPLLARHPDVHPRLARYPQPMVRACDLHLSTLLAWDDIDPGSTHQWLVAWVPYR